MQNFTLLSKETDQEIFEIHFDCHNHKQELHRQNQLHPPKLTPRTHPQGHII